MLRTNIASLSLSSILLAAGVSPPAAAQWVEKGCETLFTVESDIASDFFGWTTVSLGDVNDDGVIDIAVSAPFTGNSSGTVYAYSGADGALIWSRSENLASAILGFAMQTADWNHDGIKDVIAGAPFANFGTVWIYNGLDGSTLLELQSGVFQDGIGAAIAANGDFNGDGVNDLLAGAFGADPTEDQIDYGRAYVYSGVDASLITTIDGPFTNASFGIGLAYIGDISDPPDGRDDIVVGNRMGDEDPEFFEGQARVYSYNGREAVLEYMIENVGMGYSLIGDRIDGGKDVNNDGVPDILVGDMFAEVISIFSGVDGTLIHALSDPFDGVTPEIGALVDDLNGDGHADIVAGNWVDDGRAFVLSGADGSVLQTMTPTIEGINVGIEMRDAGDFNNDGAIDFLLGATGGGFNGPPKGAVYIVSGTISAPNAPGDLNGDGIVGTTDLLLLLGAWGPCGDCGDCAADLDGDCNVGTGDLIILLGNWG